MTPFTPALDPFFSAYEELAAEADALFSRVAVMHPDCVTCKPGCGDCCRAAFDLSLIEAMYLNCKFQEAFASGPERTAILERAAAVDRKLARAKRGYFREFRDGDGSEEAVGAVLSEASKTRFRCPLLDEEELCLLYPHRPIACRLYGVPAEIGGKTRVCGKSAFVAGRGYPTVRLSKIQDRLDLLSRGIRDALASRFSELHAVYVPVAMALLTDYDDGYLGVGPAPEDAR